MLETKRTILWMSLFLAAVALICGALIQPLAGAFEANPVFNGLIFGVLVIGVVVTFDLVLRLGPASAWIDDRERGATAGTPPPLLAPIAILLRGREQGGVRLSAMAMHSLLGGVRLRLDEARDIARYLVGLLIFLGLLGTFWGLLETVGGVARILSSLSAGAGDMSTLFDAVKRDLQGPLAGMGTAFSTSLFGLGGALILGALDLQAGHAQNRFSSRLEEWLSGMTHLPSARIAVEGDYPLPSYIEALLKQTAENLDQVQRMMARGEEDRQVLQFNLGRLAEQLAALTDQLRTEQKLTVALAKNQSELQYAIAALTDQLGGTFSGYEQIRDHLRSADVSLSHLVQEVSRAREQVPDEMRKEVRLLAQSLAREPRVGK